MANETKEPVLGTGSSILSPEGYQKRKTVAIKSCDLHVTPAPKAILGKCNYYYEPLHEEYISKSGVSTWQAIKEWAKEWNPYDDHVVLEKILNNRDKLLKPSSIEGWSRHGNFMARHVGCGHKPPDYYVSYGYYYCSRYGAYLFPRLTSQGKVWLTTARKNLQVELEKAIAQNMRNSENVTIMVNGRARVITTTKFQLEIQNDNFKKAAFTTHVPAYLNAGLADLDYTDLLKIGTMPNIEEWMDGDTWQQALDASMGAIPRRVQNFQDAVGQRMDEAKKALGRLLSW